MAITSFPTHLGDLKKELAQGNATEHTHRPALKSLVESLYPGLTVTNEPKRIPCGAPDIIIARKRVPPGLIETKVVALKETIRLGAEIDAALDDHGGRPLK